MTYNLVKFKDGNQIIYRVFEESITTINISLPNMDVCRPKPLIGIGSQILSIEDMENYAKAILTACQDARNIEWATEKENK